MTLFPGFTTRRIEIDGLELFCRIGGSGPALLLLHGFPETGAMWSPIAPALAERFTVVAPDLPGYGRSGKPADEADSAQMSKRALAGRLAGLMTALGHDRFTAIGHDRGARVTHRMCLDHASRITRAVVMDIAPTRIVFDEIDQAMAMAYYHWFFLAQGAPFPERMIAPDPDLYFERCLGGWGTGLDRFEAEALAEYRASWRDPATIHAMCEDYRAGAGIDLVHDRADEDARIACPLLVLWGADGIVARNYDVPAIWRGKATDVTAQPIPGGHFFIEESPDATLAALTGFLMG